MENAKSQRSRANDGDREEREGGETGETKQRERGRNEGLVWIREGKVTSRACKASEADGGTELRGGKIPALYFLYSSHSGLI